MGAWLLLVHCSIKVGFCGGGEMGIGKVSQEGIEPMVRYRDNLWSQQTRVESNSPFHGAARSGRVKVR
jgi:hypothetical protein